MRLSIFAALLLSASLAAGCAGRVEYRTYDPYYHDYHVWGDAELPYYHAWIVETHHPNIDYQHLRRQDREQYWRWRHDHK